MRRKRGVTLVELLIVMAVMTMVLVGVLGVFGTISRQWNRHYGRSHALLTANAAMDAMAKEIRQAISLQGSDESKNYVFWMPAHQDAEGNYIPTLIGNTLQYVTGARVRFYLSDTTGLANGGTVLWRETKLLGLVWTPDSTWSRSPGTATRGKYPNITSLTFTTGGMPPNTVRVTLTVSIKEGGKTTTETVQRDIYMSNHN